MMLDHFSSNQLALANSLLPNMPLDPFLVSVKLDRLHPVLHRAAFHQHHRFSHELLQRRLLDFLIQIVSWKCLPGSNVGRL